MHRELEDGWYTSSAEVIWGAKRHATFVFVPAGALPALPPVRLDDSFAWLPELSPRRSPLHYHDDLGGSEQGHANIDQLQREAERGGLKLPAAFVHFMRTPTIHGRVPSNTDCFLEPSGRLFAGPNAGDPILRFLVDSQGCVAWYLQLAADGGSRVLATLHTDYDGDEQVPEPGGAVYVVGASFELFVHRFWLENNLWFKVIKKEALTPDEQAYVKAAKRASRLVGDAFDSGA